MYITYDDIGKAPRIFRKNEDKTVVEILERTEEEEFEGAGEKSPFLCATCKNPITTRDMIISINGSQRHTFSNPSGMVFQVICIASAPGCFSRGVYTLEFTWFAGFAWRFALCGNCRDHLGWQYQSLSGEHFYGLIRDKLVEEKKS